LWSPLVGAEKAFVPGSVTSRAQSLRIGGYTGGLEYATTLGIALTRAQGQQGNAQAQAIDFGVFGLILSQPGECTGTAVLPPEQVPRPLRVNSVKGDRSATNRYADGQFVRGGTESVSATTRPSASSRTDVGEVELPSVVTLDGLRSTADSSITERSGRRDSQATASVGAVELADGAVRLENVRWSMAKTTGAPRRSSGAFTIGRIVVAGVELPSESAGEIAGSLDAANAALAPSGIALSPPASVRRSDGTTEITPLVVQFGGTGATNPVLGTLFEQLQPLRDAVYEQAQQAGCPADPVIVNGALTVLDIFLAGLSGSGGLRFEVGGVRMLHDTRAFSSPFRDIPPLAFVPPPSVPAAVPGTPPTRGEREVDALPGAAGRTVTRCETTHPSGRPECSRGSAVMAGIASLLVVLGLVGAETYRTRRRRA
jgi:hypothetical protein